MFIIAANWKMNGDPAFAAEYAEKLGAHLAQKNNSQNSHEVVVFPPAPLLPLLKCNGFKKGGQDCYHKEYGPFTGEISPFMLKDAGAEYVILGHSERREAGETSELVAAKAANAYKAGLKTIICVGEKKGEDFETVVFEQLKKSVPFAASEANTVIAYEPVWAIGTGITPTIADIEQRQTIIAGKTKLQVLYGGSVKPENAGEISSVASVNGLLIGGASLSVDSFLSIINNIS